MNFKTILPLKLENNRSLYFNPSQLESFKKEIENFLNGEDYMNSLFFSKKVLFSHEIQANNTIEGYNDDVSVIESIIKKTSDISDIEKRKRILNLYKGYKFILKNDPITTDSLKTLYSILSKDLLSSEDLSNMGDYYRKNPVYIFYSSNLEKEPDEGVNPNLIEQLMDSLFEYINNNSFNNSTDVFIKSQIIHFYFVYLHPYYDINGRTARTLSMWYLLNNQSYPFIIFNRAITNTKKNYYEAIRDVKKYHNLTFFIKYMLDNLMLELEKEYVMEKLSQKASTKLTALDYQSLQYILSTNGLKTLNDFTHFYNKANDKKRNKQVLEEMINPLLDKGLLNIVRTTKGTAFNNQANFVYKLNYDNCDIDYSKIKRLHLQ